VPDDQTVDETPVAKTDAPLNVLVLGGDGFIGWPVSLYLSRLGHRVFIVDNLSRREIDVELHAGSLTPIATPFERLDAWEEMTGNKVCFDKLDIADHDGASGKYFIENWIESLGYVDRPDAIVHLAEQRAAPYSMKTAKHKRYTVDNNIRATHNLLAACAGMTNPPHIVHIGSMGVYGYGATGGVIPEGYLDIQVIEAGGPSFAAEILHPTSPGSVYHMTKCMDQTMFQFYAKNDGLRITDLHQGIVWGTQTDETELDTRLINRFDYCGDYGTVLNRFLVEAATGYPLTVHGSGNQTRAFIHIRDTVRCVDLALHNPPATGDRPRILNQMTECHRLIDLARMVSEMTGAEIAHTPNPRKEAAENDLMVCNDSLLNMGLEPTTLEAGLMTEIRDIAERYADRIDRSKIPCRSTWTREQEPGVPTGPEPL
jgi:UDP-sulfoquinovose synthase